MRRYYVQQCPKSLKQMEKENTMDDKIISHTFTIKKEIVKVVRTKKTMNFKEVEITKELLDSLPKGSKFILPSWDNKLDHYEYDDIYTYGGKVKNKNSTFYGQYHYYDDCEEGWIEPDKCIKRMYIVV